MKIQVKLLCLLMLSTGCSVLVSQSSPSHDETSEESWLSTGLQAGVGIQMLTNWFNDKFEEIKKGAIVLKNKAGSALTEAERETLAEIEAQAEAAKIMAERAKQRAADLAAKAGEKVSTAATTIEGGVQEAGEAIEGAGAEAIEGSKGLISRLGSKFTSAFKSIKLPWFSGAVKEEVENGVSMATEKAIAIAGENGAAVMSELATPGILSRILASASELTGFATGTLATGGTLIGGMAIWTGIQMLAEAAARMMEQSQQLATSDNPDDVAKAAQLAQDAQALSDEAAKQTAKLNTDANPK